MNVTYYFGAGASCNALPIINQIPNRITDLVNYLKNEGSLHLSESEPLKKITIEQNQRSVQVKMYDDLNWLAAETKKHASVDTLAKKLFIKKRYEDLKRLKIALSVFFILEQAKNKPDPRYDAFYASLLNDSIISLPKNVKIISWNYDYQFELAFSGYTENTELLTNQTFLNVVQKRDNDSEVNDIFGIYKLNGTTSLYQPMLFHHFQYLSNLNTNISKKMLESIIENYANAIFREDVSPTLSFAWEKENTEKNIITKTISATKNTEILVVIGYSFPFFNREVDKAIIHGMNSLKKVYFQAPHPHADSIKERFQSINVNLKSSDLIIKNDVEQFLIPFEL
ncbi:MAG: hypothetical protein KAY50_01300 [Chitinophagaceae bacterium]|nr:hypothetical protein [Chitinophagaceae bacterium]